MEPFDFAKSINSKSKYLMDDKNDEGSYVPFLMNRNFSYYLDTIFYANDMNMSRLDNKLQYDYLYNSIVKRSRFVPWPKKKNTEYLSFVMEYYKCNSQRGLEIIQIIPSTKLEEMREDFIRGKDNINI